MRAFSGGRLNICLCGILPKLNQSAGLSNQQWPKKLQLTPYGIILSREISFLWLPEQTWFYSSKKSSINSFSPNIHCAEPAVLEWLRGCLQQQWIKNRVHRNLQLSWVNFCPQGVRCLFESCGQSVLKCEMWNPVTMQYCSVSFLKKKSGHMQKTLSHTQTHAVYLCEVQVKKAECEELQADRATVEQPVGQRLQLIGLHHIFKVKRKEGRPQRCPKQTQKQKHTLVAEALVSVVQNKTELQVHKNKKERVEDCVNRCYTELQCRGNCSSMGLLQWGKQCTDRLSFRKHIRTNTSAAAKSEKHQNWVRLGLDSPWTTISHSIQNKIATEAVFCFEKNDA